MCGQSVIYVYAQGSADYGAKFKSGQTAGKSFFPPDIGWGCALCTCTSVTGFISQLGIILQ